MWYDTACFTIYVQQAVSILFIDKLYVIGIDINIEIMTVSLAIWEAQHSQRAKYQDCGEIPMSLMRPQWPKLRYQYLFYYDESKWMMNKQMLSK